MITKTMKLSEINAAGYNPRKDLKKNDSAYKSLKRSMDEYGFIVPLIYNEQTKTLISGHQRLKVLKDKRKSLEGVLVPITAKWNEELLESAGFSQIDCFWRCLNFAGWIAIK